MKKLTVSRLMALTLAGLMVFGNSLAVPASENEPVQEIIKAEDVDLSGFVMPDFREETISSAEEIDVNAPTSISIDKTKESIDVSARLNQRAGFQFDNNPNVGVSGQLTEANPMDVYFFSATQSDKFMVAKLNSGNSNYVAHLCLLDSEGNATATNIYGFAGSLIQLNGLPVGDYAMLIYSNDNTYGSSYTFNMNASNPAANLSKAIYLSSDLSIFMFETTAGDVYGNGSFIYNTSTRTGDLGWERIDEVSWGSGYEQRTHSVFGVKVKAVSGPVKYSSAKAYSDCAVLIYCDIDTHFSYLHTFYQSGIDPIYESTTIDTTGQRTPRTLDEFDFEGGNEHIIVFDLNTGKAIDFYSTLNIFYAGGYESQPKINFY